MAYVAYSNSPIHVRQVGAVDPGFGQGGGEVDNTLPGGGHPSGQPLPPHLGLGGGTLPEAPPGIWPPPSFNHPWAPIPPDASTKPPPGAVWPPLGNTLPDGEFWVVAGIPGVGWRYICVDLKVHIDAGLPSGGARPDNSLPSSPGHPANRPPGTEQPDNTLPPTATPRR